MPDAGVTQTEAWHAPETQALSLVHAPDMALGWQSPPSKSHHACSGSQTVGPIEQRPVAGGTTQLPQLHE